MIKRLVTAGILTALVTILLPVLVFAWPVPDTGQTQCYDDDGNVIPCPSPGERFHGQDGNYSINPNSYTKLAADGTELLDDAASWVMVRDNVTGLIWEVKRNMDGVMHYDDPRDADNTYTWYDSNPDTNGGNAGTPGDGTDTEDFINILNNAHFGGYSDWRLPSINELDSIVNFGILDPGSCINTTYFPNIQSGIYWSSVTYAYNRGCAWIISFYDGSNSFPIKAGSYYVRAVRGEQ